MSQHKDHGEEIARLLLTAPTPSKESVVMTCFGFFLVFIWSDVLEFDLGVVKGTQTTGDEELWGGTFFVNPHEQRNLA